ncbi:hypothetical protein MP638_000247 [Amoeboaphelidium occidentale]|nr:hypothetical protein MP638_000247 [Amoeboaphelidium occidentale]
MADQTTSTESAQLNIHLPKQQTVHGSGNLSHKKGSAMTKFVELMFKYSPALVLENKGATARDHLANERTYLAYLRTSLSILTVGVASVQLFRLAPKDNSAGVATVDLARAVGGTLIVLSILFILLGATRYYYTQGLMIKGLFPASRLGISVLSGLLILVTVFILVVTMII